jgi:hypothetical protein
MQVVKCPHCSAELFISSSRAPVCGKCGGMISVRRGSIWGWFQKLFGGRQNEPKQRRHVKAGRDSAHVFQQHSDESIIASACKDGDRQRKTLGEIGLHRPFLAAHLR